MMWNKRIGSWLLAGLMSLSVWGQQEPKPMKIISYNIWNGFERDSLRKARFVEWINGQQADIVVLDELVGFKVKDLVTLGAACGFPHTALSKETGYAIGVMSKKELDVKTKQTEGYWHGMIHVRTQGIDVIATHLSPFDWKFRLREANNLVNYIKEHELTDFIVAGDMNAHSPLDADELITHDTLLVKLQQWDNGQEKYRNLRDGRYDYSVISRFMSIGMEDAIGRLVHPAEKRMSFPSVFRYNGKVDEALLKRGRERLDYIMLSPSLMPHCTQAGVERVEGVSDHYPVWVKLSPR